MTATALGARAQQGHRGSLGLAEALPADSELSLAPATRVRAALLGLALAAALLALATIAALAIAAGPFHTSLGSIA